MPYRKQILVVEDNDLNRAILCEILSQEYHTLEAGNGQDALCVLKEHPDDVALILLDVMMPVMDGYAFLDRIKADKKLSLIPVIVMTQGSSEADELNALAHGATDFVPKPYRPQIILHRIAGLIKLRETAAMVNQLQYDRLTGLYSKEYFFQKVRDQLLQDPDDSYAIICSNVENFKAINDIFGIQTGDQLLKEIARISKAKVGPAGFCGRFDADRFLFFIKQAPDAADCSQYEIVEKHTLSSPFQNVVIHWGVYKIHDPTVPVEQMCDRALLAVDSIKHQYRSVAVYDDSLRSKLLREQWITAGMETALQEGQFIIYLQPKYSLRDNCMAGAEALVRWIHPQWGFMFPGEFIPLFEKNGFIPKLDQYVWEQVCILLRKWKQQGLSLLPVSVNVSRADIFQADLANTILSLTQKYDIDPAYLHLEITESAYVDKTSRIVSTVAALRKMGFVIELDDFGSGYSSLNTMSQLPLDILKLDMKFVQSELSKPADQSVLVDVISMAHRTHLNVVAEGVETHDQINRLRSVGCDYVQGFFLAKPMPAAEFEELLKTNQSNLIHFQPGTQRSGVSMPKLLVADPDAAYREAVRKYFAGQYAVLEADNAGDALSYFRSGNGNNIAAVILCAATAGRDAQALLKTLRQNPAHWDVPVLATIPNSACANQYPLVQEADDFLCKCHPISDLRRRVQRVIEIATFQRKESILRDAANRDHLTGLFNRRGLQEAMRSIVDTDFPLALCLVDLDDLKQLNDSFGHDQGDWLLQSFSYLIRRMTHTEDILCRYGGDEFILVLKHLHSPGTAVKKCEAICRAFQKHTEKAGFPNSCSIGIALCDSIDELSASLITRADQVLYRAKRENKGGCVLWEEA